MLIQLTNANDTNNGQSILLNTDMILSAYRGVKAYEDKTVKDITYIYMPPHGTWEVEETPEEISQIIEGKRPKIKVSTGKTNGK